MHTYTFFSHTGSPSEAWPGEQRPHSHPTPLPSLFSPSFCSSPAPRTYTYAYCFCTQGAVHKLGQASKLPTAEQQNWMRGSLFGHTLTIPVVNGRFEFGTWQGIYLGTWAKQASAEVCMSDGSAFVGILVRAS